MSHDSPGAPRRQFIRILGGGAVFAATAAMAGTLAGCSSEMPADAVAPWSGPGNEPDLRRWILAHAILAPHSHNLQSWLVDLSQPGEMHLFCDTTRLLPQTDPFNRQIMMSQGTFLELLVLAARQRGQRAEVTLFPDGVFEGPVPEAGPKARAVARVRLVADATLAPDPLFQQIFKRHTHKGLYDPAREVSDAAWTAMAEAAQPAAGGDALLPPTTGLRFGRLGPSGTGDAAALERQREIAREAWRIELTTPRTMLESLKLVRLGAREISQHRDGISLTDPMLVLLGRVGLFDRSKAPAADDPAITGQIKDFNANLASTHAFLWMTTPGNDRATQVNAGRAYARVQLAATAHGVVMQPLQQALQEYTEVAPQYRAIHQLLAPQGETVQMWARVGYTGGGGRHDGQAPRRGVDAIIRA
jgi:hypothetical protein